MDFSVVFLRGDYDYECSYLYCQRRGMSTCLHYRVRSVESVFAMPSISHKLTVTNTEALKLIPSQNQDP